MIWEATHMTYALPYTPMSRLCPARLFTVMLFQTAIQIRRHTYICLLRSSIAGFQKITFPPDCVHLSYIQAVVYTLQ
jgi:hypothetical protein